MIKEKLKRALNEVVDRYNGGDMSANEAIAKVAEEMDLTPDSRKRLVEMYNTAGTICYYDSHKSDRTGSFELASSEKVAELIEKQDESRPIEAGIDPVKAASARLFYHEAPDACRIRQRVARAKMDEMSKAAADRSAVEAENSRIESLDPEKMTRQFRDEIRKMDKEAEEISDALLLIRRNYVDNARCAASALESGGSSCADLFKVACHASRVLEKVSEYSPLLAKATGGVHAYRSVIDVSPISDVMKIASEMERLLEYEDEMSGYEKAIREKKAEYEKTWGEIWGVVPSEKKASIDVNPYWSSRSPLSPAGSDKESGSTGGHDDGMSKLADLVYPVNSESLIDTLSRTEKIENRPEKILNLYRGNILSDLMQNDPIIRDADPKRVIETYKTMCMVAPRSSLDKSQVRSVLRTSENSTALSPADAMTIAGVDKAISQAERLSELDSSIKDSNSRSNIA